MRDVNAPLKLALKELLEDIPYPVYNNYVPASEDGEAYILISGVSNSDRSSMHSADTSTTVQIGIYTRAAIQTGDSVCDLIAQMVYDRIYPMPGSVITLPDGIQNYGITMDSDAPQVLNLNSFVFINRIITFSFQLMHHTLTI